MMNIHLRKQQGFTTLAMTLVILLAVTLVSFFTAKSVVVDQRVTANTLVSAQAFTAAQSGLDYGMLYLAQNKESIANNQVITGSLSNGASYSVQYIFQGGSNALVNVRSTGTSADATTTRVVQQLVQYFGFSGTVPTLPAQVRGNLQMSGSSSMTNLDNNSTVILSGSSASFSGNAQTVLASGVSSDRGGLGSDVTLNDSTLGAMSDLQLQTNTFGISIANMKLFASQTYSNSSNHNYNSELDGQTGKLIWITQSGGTARISSNTTIGSPSAPVTLVVDGNLTVNGSVTIYGSVIVTGKLDLKRVSQLQGLAFALGTGSGNAIKISGNANVTGAVISGGKLKLQGSGSINYNTSVLDGALPSYGTYGRIAGSWQDLQVN